MVLHSRNCGILSTGLAVSSRRNDGIKQAGILNLKNQNSDDATIYNYLRNFFDENLVQMVFEDFRGNPFEALPTMHCQEPCDKNCELYSYCITRTEKEIYRNIRSKVLT